MRIDDYFSGIMLHTPVQRGMFSRTHSTPPIMLSAMIGIGTTNLTWRGSAFVSFISFWQEWLLTVFILAVRCSPAPTFKVNTTAGVRIWDPSVDEPIFQAVAQYQCPEG